MTKVKALIVAVIAALTLGACAGMNSSAPFVENSAFPAGTLGSPD